MVFRSLLLFSPAALLKTNGIFRAWRRHLQALEKAPFFSIVTSMHLHALLVYEKPPRSQGLRSGYKML